MARARIEQRIILGVGRLRSIEDVVAVIKLLDRQTQRIEATLRRDFTPGVDLSDQKVLGQGQSGDLFARALGTMAIRVSVRVNANTGARIDRRGRVRKLAESRCWSPLSMKAAPTRFCLRLPAHLHSHTWCVAPMLSSSSKAVAHRKISS